MGLGLHGGGLASAKFLADAGADVTVTDLRDADVLKPSMEALGDRNLRYVLGRHEMEDFVNADFVLKNPAVRRSSPYLSAAKAIETDVSIFLRLTSSPIIAVTGSKGKSSTVSAIQHCLVRNGIHSLLGGNITISPLSFLDETGTDAPVVLELSSWQLADMKGLGVLKPRVAVITAIMPDHMNYYSSMEEYVNDKRLIYADQDNECFTICDFDSPWGRSFADETRAKVLWYSDSRKCGPGGWIDHLANGACGLVRFPDSGSEIEKLIPETLLVPGRHMKKNLLAAGCALRAFGLGSSAIFGAMADFPGVEHRLEFFAESRGVRWYNDSASTIPQAVRAALSSFDEPVILITGGTDKNIDFELARGIYGKAEKIILLAGSGTDKLMPILRQEGLAWQGPYDNLAEAVSKAGETARPGNAVILSPGCASFGMFLHEFDRGKKFKDAVRSLFDL